MVQELFEAIRNNNMDRLADLLNRSNQKDRNKDLLNLAVRSKNLDAVKILLKNQVNPNLQDKEGKTALIEAVCGNNLGSLRKSLNYADPNPRFGNIGLIDIVTINIIRELLNAGANPNLRDKEGNTALMVAVLTNNLGIVRELLNQLSQRVESDPNLRGKDGDTPLIKAVLMSNLDIVQELLKYNANPNLRNKEGNTALILAIKENKLEIASLLLKYGANPSFRANLFKLSK